jgi:hypothetical protein
MLPEISTAKPIIQLTTTTANFWIPIVEVTPTTPRPIQLTKVEIRPTNQPTTLLTKPSSTPSSAVLQTARPEIEGKFTTMKPATFISTSRYLTSTPPAVETSLVEINSTPKPSPAAIISTTFQPTTLLSTIISAIENSGEMEDSPLVFQNSVLNFDHQPVLFAGHQISEVHATMPTPAPNQFSTPPPEVASKFAPEVPTSTLPSELSPIFITPKYTDSTPFDLLEPLSTLIHPNFPISSPFEIQTSPVTYINTPKASIYFTLFILKQNYNKTKHRIPKLDL